MKKGRVFWMWVWFFAGPSSLPADDDVALCGKTLESEERTWSLDLAPGGGEETVRMLLSGDEYAEAALLERRDGERIGIVRTDRFLVGGFGDGSDVGQLAERLAIPTRGEEPWLEELGGGTYLVTVDHVPAFLPLPEGLEALAELAPALVVLHVARSELLGDGDETPESPWGAPDFHVTRESGRDSPVRILDRKATPDLWGLEAVGVSRVRQAIRQGTLTLQPTRVAVLDTGVSYHQQLEGRLLCHLGLGCPPRKKPGTRLCQASTCRASTPACCRVDRYEAFDKRGHGTQVAGVIASPLYGVADQARLVPIRALDRFSCGWSSWLVRGIEHAVSAPRQVRVIAAAWDVPEQAVAVKNAICRASSRALFVTPAGNYGKDIDRHPIFPAGWSDQLDNLIVVGGITSNDERVGNWGPRSIQIAAPAQQITVLSLCRGCPPATCRGTSLAVGFVAGVAALYLGQHPGASPKDVRQRLIETAKKRGTLTTLCNDCGIVDAPAALGLPP